MLFLLKNIKKIDTDLCSKLKNLFKYYILNNEFDNKIIIEIAQLIAETMYLLTLK